MATDDDAKQVCRCGNDPVAPGFSKALRALADQIDYNSGCLRAP